jgi:SAM-dependent methyltransferase
MIPQDRVTNLFVSQGAARRYAEARPYFHPLVMAQIVRYTGRSQFNMALDIGCGTGQSSRALTMIAETVEAIDASEAMLAEAPRLDSVRYQLACAEAIPFSDQMFDLATVGLAYHWFDQAAFMAEASRVLQSEGWLVVYTSSCTGEMSGNADFGKWYRNVYSRQFPPVPRCSFGNRMEATAAPYGLNLKDAETFIHDELMTLEQFTAYLLTQSNVIAAIDKCGVPVEEIAGWLGQGAKPFFGDHQRTIEFVGSIWYLRRSQQPLLTF